MLILREKITACCLAHLGLVNINTAQLLFSLFLDFDRNGLLCKAHQKDQPRNTIPIEIVLILQ